MPFSEWATLAACAGQLGLAVLVIRAPRGSLTPPLALLCLVLFTWNAAGVIDRTGGGDAWKWVDVVTSPWTVPLGLHFFLAFVGLRRQHRILLYVTYALFGLFSLVTAVSAFVPLGGHFPWGNAWPIVYLALLLPTVGAGTGVLVRHLLEAKSAEEVVRARLLLSGLAVALAVGLTELLTGFGVRVVSLSGPGMLVVTAIMAVLTLRWGLLEDVFRRRTAIFAFSVSLMGLIGYFSVFDLISDNLALLLFATVIATLAATVVTRYVLSLVSARRERMAQLVTLGRFSQQMAHDLKNPIAAMKGAVQYLQEEARRGGDLSRQREILDLLAAQVSRLSTLVDEYHRMGRIEPRRTEVDLNAMLRQILGMQTFVERSRIHVEMDLDEGLPPVWVDRDLLGRALENIVRNAYEAMEGEGTLSVRTWQAEENIVVSIRDSGPGMDGRTREHALDEFFTTKAQGTGLGLSFARRVLEAHGGRLELRSRLGEGTEVVLRIPAGARATLRGPGLVAHEAPAG